MYRRLLLCFTCLSVMVDPAQALNNSADDEDNRKTNATVWAAGCTGTLISPDIVVSAGHCGDVLRRPPVTDPAVAYPNGCADREVSGRWYPLPGRPEIRVGNDLSDLSSERVFRTKAFEYAIPGCADVMLLRLEDSVPDTLATPVKILTEVGDGVGATAGDALFRGARFTAAGWGLVNGARIRVRQTAQVRFVGSNNSFVNTAGPDGTSITSSGDSGGPLYWDAPSGRRYLVGVLQGGSPDRYTPTFRNSHSGFPDIGSFFEHAVPDAVTCDQSPDRPAGTIPLHRYYDGDQEDNFTTAQKEWWGCTETRRAPNYKMSRLEGYIFSPLQPQPQGTVRLFSWWSPDRSDNVITSFPTWIYWPGGPRTRDPNYQLVGLEGYVFDPSRPQPAGTMPLYAWLSQERDDYWVTTQHARRGAAGEGLDPGYERPTLMGYVFRPSTFR